MIQTFLFMYSLNDDEESRVFPLSWYFFFVKHNDPIVINCMYSFLSQADKSSVEAGAEIYINYGNKGNEVLLT